ncbi:YhgE/Pip domain-containing protein [Corynebacterium pelargi]|uniref:ABC-2 family transporter protein n=1 Tax=Corynebacterium pelargi TaxID=1471400 RepID=A0A410W6Y7_9CORY|nr:YhgE/Pip domain-containing protein [Corynebacterium pelargi]QAU51644.1 ABC-2 family transporter protein [Corynebacterium pelargi]GGG80240.1 membrane protein [Corynebacterium pelargi]
MNLFHIGSELRRFGTGKFPLATVFVLILIPLLFGGLFVWSYWDPASRVKDLPVALVNSDEGAKINGQDANVGQNVVDTLIDSGRVEFKQVDPDEALKGVKDGTYYFAIEVPKDFSQAVATAQETGTPDRTTLTAVFNNANGYLGAVMGNTIVSNVVKNIDSLLGSQVTARLLVGYSTVPDPAAPPENPSAAEGTWSIAEGIDRLDAGAHQLADGSVQLKDGVGEANDGVGALADGLKQLQGATDKLGGGAGEVADGVRQVQENAEQLAGKQKLLASALVDIDTGLREIGTPEAMRLADQTKGLIDAIKEGQDPESLEKLQLLAAGAAEVQRQLLDPQAEYRGGLIKVQGGTDRLKNGTQQLFDASEQLTVGTRQLADGTTQLAEGTDRMVVAASMLSDGLVELGTDGSQLALQVANGDEDKPEQATSTNPGLPLSGMGLAPIFISMGLFVGATTTYMVFRPLQRRVIESGAAPFKVVMASFLPTVIIGLAQATVMYLVQHFALGLEAHRGLGLLAAMYLWSMTAMAIAQGLNAIFGVALGRTLGMALMTLQMVSSGGLYPAETQPAPLRWFHTFDPMTYSVNLMRQMIFDTDLSVDHRMWISLAVLVGILVLFLLGSTFAAARERQFKYQEFRPQVTV